MSASMLLVPIPSAPNEPVEVDEPLILLSPVIRSLSTLVLEPATLKDKKSVPVVS